MELALHHSCLKWMSLARGVDFELHYAYRSPEHAALLNDLMQNHAGHVFSYVDSEGCSLDLDELISS